uniref:Putative quorum-sensing-regulated virulence factor n=1 Tax=viral metagenome TaxID=1070528 RepID=A0A6M3JEV4_9ZZZZ
MTPQEIKAIEIAQNFKIPFGRYKGKPLDSINSSYLRWLATDCDNAVVSHHADVLWNWREEMDEHI